MNRNDRSSVRCSLEKSGNSGAVKQTPLGSSIVYRAPGGLVRGTVDVFTPSLLAKGPRPCAGGDPAFGTWILSIGTEMSPEWGRDTIIESQVLIRLCWCRSDGLSLGITDCENGLFRPGFPSVPHIYLGFGRQRSLPHPEFWTSRCIAVCIRQRSRSLTEDFIAYSPHLERLGILQRSIQKLDMRVIDEEPPPCRFRTRISTYRASLSLEHQRPHQARYAYPQ